MTELNKEELLSVDGGANSTLTSTLISTYIKGANVYYEIGKSLGVTFKKIISIGIYSLI